MHALCHGLHLPLHYLDASLIIVPNLKQPFGEPLLCGTKTFSGIFIQFFPNIHICINIWAASWQFLHFNMMTLQVINHRFGSMTWGSTLYKKMPLFSGSHSSIF
jgi:hypothetical protein